MKLLIMQFSPISCHFISLRSKYSPQHPVLKHPHFLLKSKRLSASIVLIIHKAIIRSVMAYASPAWAFAVDTYLMKLQGLQKWFSATIGNYPRRTWIRDLHMVHVRVYMII
jgi:hypothetical protein